MSEQDTHAEFTAQILRPKAQDAQGWGFVLIPHDVSAKLPRRGRTSVQGQINGHDFQALLEPDGQKSHWLRLDEALMSALNVCVGQDAHIALAPMEEPEPQVPDDLAQALDAAPEAKHTWEATTTLARLDWIHWITTAKQAKTRAKRISSACDMLASGKKRVCCFDPSGYYSKAFSAPQACES